MSNIEALKNLAVAMGCATDVGKVDGNSVASVIQFIAENLPKSKE